MKCLFAAVAVVLLGGSQALAWDDVGHKLTTYIAWESMSPAARSESVRLLLAAAEDTDLNVHFRPFESRSESVRQRELFMYASTWPDVVRDRSFPVRYGKYHKGNWHYAAIFWSSESGILEDFKGEGGVAIPKLSDFEKTLRDPDATDQDKAVALAWFLHVAGDIHNPLHNGSRVTELEPSGDQGGNLFKLEEERADGGWRLNLHSYWDSIVSNTKDRKNDECDHSYLPPIAAKLMKKHPSSGFDQTRFEPDYANWNREGYGLLSTVVYTDDLARDRRPSRKYSKRTYKISGEQLSLAGYRIAAVLNEVFRKDGE